MVIVHGLIPARSGSKGIKDKCIKLYKGVPLLAHSISVGLGCSLIDRIVVSTDSEDYANIAREHGAEVPFLRPSDISGDLSPDIEFFKHYIEWLKSNNQECPDIIVHLRPTYPNRNMKFVTKVIQSFLDVYDDYDSLRTVVSLEKSSFKTYIIDSNRLQPLIPKWDDMLEPFNRCRQELPQCYIHNGCIDIVKTDVVTKHNSVSGQRILPYVMTSNNDIDTLKDWYKSENASS